MVFTQANILTASRSTTYGLGRLLLRMLRSHDLMEVHRPRTVDCSKRLNHFASTECFVPHALSNEAAARRVHFGRRASHATVTHWKRDVVSTNLRDSHVHKIVVCRRRLFRVLSTACFNQILANSITMA
ncbi:hypothetical protein K1T71_000573 [Dendrolimus kikuchii]|uniref:Uncharacterized protein n=1 Tax=Dendrolimus kikuchii TaxID=765133 RepID=A0ACC1DK26_9NEOP|nr:hypothetical protein K1T71_000573 [Dendrolimus kikuchii]